MPGTTRYSATFDRTYEEEDRAKPPSPPNARRSRSQSWQANSGLDGRQYTPFMGRSPGPRSSSTDNNPNKGTEHIPTRTAKTSVKAHNNPFQFVKVGTCPLYKKAEEQLKKVKEIKKPDVLKEEEEEWQSNLDSWKSRRRKMSEDVFRRQEELKLLELEEQIAQVSQKKTKTFSEMVESRATRGRALSLCLLTSPLEFQNWEFENKTHKNGSCSYTDESGENSTVNSEDEGVSVRARLRQISHSENEINHRTNGDAHIEHNGSELDKQNGNCKKLSNDVQMKPKENSYIDSGLESISSSHRAGDTPDSGSDFSQDSNSSIDCDSPRTGVNVLEEFSSKSSQISEGHETNISLKLDEKGHDFGFTFLGGKDEGQVIIASILEGSKAESSGVHLGDRIIIIDGCDVSSKKHIEIAALIQRGREKGQMNLLLWRHNKSTKSTNGFNAAEKHDKVITDGNLNAKSYEKSVESENEMYVDDFEELKRQSELLALNTTPDTPITNSQAPAKGNNSPNKDAISLKTSVESSTAPILKIDTSDSAVEEPDKNEQKTEINSVVNNDDQKKNIIKVKRTRRKGVYALNVDSNQISQDGNSTNFLFPLSPVTELPSPADETKTVSSTLSSNNILSVSNSQNQTSVEEKEKIAKIKPAIPIVKENGCISSTSSKSESFKQDANFVTSLKNAENKIQINTDNKAVTENAPSLTSSDKNPQNERPKSLSIPKKVKSSKVKKEITSEKTSASTENVKDVSCSTVPAVKTVTQGKELSESKSFSTVANNQSNMKNDQENTKASKAVENGITSPEDITIEQTTEVVISPNKTSVESSDNGTQLLKVLTNNIEASTANKQSKVSTSENNKSKKISQKKVVTKPKEITSEKTSASNENVKEVSCSAVPTDETVKTMSQEKELSESKYFSTVANNQSNMKNDQENVTASKAVENGIISPEDITSKPTTEVIIAPNKTSVENGTQSLKVVTNNVEATIANKQSNVSTSEYNKPKKISQKKIITKSKEITSEKTSTSKENAKEVSCSAVPADKTVKTITQENELSESKSNQNQSNMKNDQENVTASKAVENGIISPEFTSIEPTTEVIIAPNKTSAESNDNGTQSLKVLTNNVEASTANKQSKVSMSENNKPKKIFQKKFVTKPKEITSEKTSASTENWKEVSCSTVPVDKTIKTVTQENEFSESKSFNSLANNQSNMKNGQENLKASKAVENGIISPEDTSIEPTTEVVITPNKTSVESSANGTQSLKVVTNNVEASTSNKQSKVSTSENNKPKKITQKKVVIKPKGNTIENNSSGTLTNSTLNEIYSTKNQNSSSLIEKQEKMGPKNETAVSPLKEENNVSLNGSANKSKPSPKDEIPNPCPTINNVRDLTLKFGEKNSSVSSESPFIAKNGKGLKSPLSEKPKPVMAMKMESPKFKENSLQQNPSVIPKMTKDSSTSVMARTSDSSISTTEEENKTKEEKMVSTISMEKQPEKKKIVATPLKRGNSGEQVPPNCQQVANSLLLSSNSNASDSPNCKNQIKGNQLKKEKKTSPVSQDEQAKTAAKNENKVSPLARENDISLDIDVNDATTSDKESHKLLPAVAPLHNPTVTSDIKPESNNVSSEISLTKNSIPNSPVNSQDEKSKLSNPKRSRNRSKKKNANSQKVNMPAKSNEESKNSNDSLNIVFQSHPQTMCSENLNNNTKNFENNSIKTAVSTTDLVADIPPVDKIAEEMEKLILEQLEEEERAKELSSGKISVESSPEHMLTAPPRLAEPPKEKPPPPPLCDGSPKESSLKRVNSTKRIKKEMYKRRSNFLGIDNADESLICSEPSVPPPPALEEILKAEMELDRQTRLKIENEATERLSLEEKEIRQKEREIIESLESEERQKMYLNGIEDCNNVFVSNTPSEAVCEQDRIETLKYERKRIDAERHLTEEQQQILLEEKQLKEREEFIRQQEAPVPLSNSSLSVSANTANNLKKPALSSLPTEAQSNGLLLGANGDGNSLTLSSTEISGNETSNKGKKFKASEKPAVPPKPLKKKEAIRKERERLRQEQEALQREREEHRRKLMLEQEELMKLQKTHAPDAPASRLGPHPPHVQPFPPQLTTTTNATLNARENASFPSRSHHGTSNGTAGSMNTVELMSPPVVRQNRLPSPRKAVQNETWGQQKMPSVRKQNHESLTESRYNQNHWLIQEAEMRRITEFKERQRTSQPPCTQTHLAEDDVCSNPPRVPVIPPTHSPHLNYPVQEKMWNYGQTTNMPLKKYPPPVVKEPPLHTIYPRETVPQQPPTKPSRVVPSERQEQMLSVSGRKRCSHCNEELGRGAAMIIESLQLYYHIHCFQCCVCQAQLGNGSCGTDVRVRNNKLHCHNCYSNDEAGLKFSQV